MQISFRKAALITGVALVATRVFGWFSLFASVASQGSSVALPAESLLILAESAAGVLVELPLPVLLMILYFADAKLSVARRLRILSVAMAVVQGLTSVGPSLYSFVNSVSQAVAYSNVHIFAGQPLASQLWRWLQSGSLSPSMREGFVLIARIAFLIFLVLLSRQGEHPDLQEDRRGSIVRTAAMVAIGTTSLILLIEIVGAPNFYHRALLLGQTSSHIVFWYIISTLSIPIFALVPWIVLKSIPSRVTGETYGESTAR